MYRAHERLMKKVKIENDIFEQFFSKVNKLKLEILVKEKENI